MNGKNEQVVEKMLSEIAIASSLMEGVDLDAFLDDDFRAEYSNVPWKAIAGFRDVAAHKYQTLRMEDVYATVSDDFPALQTMLGEIAD